MKTIKCLFLNVEAGEQPKPVDIEDNYVDYRKLIGCDWVDSAKRTINGKTFRFIVDDVGDLKKNRIPSAIDIYGRIHLFGNVVIVGEENDEGYMTSLSEEDIELIMANVIKLYPLRRPKGYYLIKIG